MYEPDTLYATYGRSRIAYQVMGEGPVDLIATSGSFGSMDAEWEQPEIAMFNRQVAEFCRLIRYDGLGSGSSDPVPIDALPPMESAAEEIFAVLDAASSERAFLIANAGSVPIALLAAATRPDRIDGLLLMHAMARMLADHDYPDGLPPEVAAELDGYFESWDADQLIRETIPSRVDDERFMRWGRRYFRSVVSPGTLLVFFRRLLNTDVRGVLPSIQAPTLVAHRFAPAFTPVRSRYSATTSAAWPCTSQPGSWEWQRPTKFSCRVLCATSWSART